MKLLASFVIGFVIGGSCGLLYLHRPQQPSASQQPATVATEQMTVQNKLDAYICTPHPENSRMICISPDDSVTFDCSSNGQAIPFLEYFC